MQKQNTPQANESISQKLIQAGTAVYDWPSTVFRNVYNKFSNLARTNHDLGFRLLERGELRDAIFRFKVALWFDDNYAMAWYNLGCCQMSLGRNKDATAAFRRVLKLVPGDENAQFMLAMYKTNLIT